MSEFDAKIDSVAGSPCVVVYRDGRPYFTVWTDDPVGHWVQMGDHQGERYAMAQEIGALITTMKSFGADPIRIHEAVKNHIVRKIDGESRNLG